MGLLRPMIFRIALGDGPGSAAVLHELAED